MTSHNLSSTDLTILKHILNILIPSGSNKIMPTASENELVEFIYRNDIKFLNILISFIKEIKLITKNEFNMNFIDIKIEKKKKIINLYEMSFKENYDQLIKLILFCYYSNKNVLKNLGLKIDPPFPEGNLLKRGDLSLLKPVIEKNIVFRT